MTWYEKVIAAHTCVTKDVSHSERLKSARYFVWQEDGANDFIADGSHAERTVTGTTDLFTKMEFDPWAEQIEQAFEDHGILYDRSSVQYETDTGFYHYEWIWEVL